jgi:hypothetical protein
MIWGWDADFGHTNHAQYEYGIKVVRSIGCIFQNIKVYQFEKGISLDGAIKNSFENVQIIGCDYGLYMGEGIDYTFTNNANSFIGCWFASNTIGVKLRSDASGNTFVGSPIEVNHDYQIMFESENNHFPTANTFIGCWMEGTAPTFVEWSKDGGTHYPSGNAFYNCMIQQMLIGGTIFNILGDGNTINECEMLYPDGALINVSGDSNVFIGNWISPIGCIIVTNTGIDNHFQANPFYVTENSGIKTITGSVSTVTVDHNLDATPTIITVTCNNTGCGDYAVTSITPTQFVITFTNQPATDIWAFYWHAEV